MIRTRTLVVLALFLLAGCSGAGTGLTPGRAPLAAATGKTAADAANAMPGDAANAMPGDAANAMPGDAANAMPGAKLACARPSQPGVASCTLAVNLNVSPNPNPALAQALIPGLHPADLRSAYGLPDQHGGTVAIVDAYDDPTAESDLAVYREAFGLPACTSANGCFRKVNQSGAAGSYPAANAGWSQEVALDLQMVSAACPQCSIVLVEANTALLDDLGAAVDTAARLGVSAISNSYYAPEWSAETGEDHHYVHPGIAITASSGDRAYASYPAASSHVTSVGGTSLARGASGWTESAWKYGGHGCSAYIGKPSWQRVAPCSSTRSAVDVSAVADPQTGVASFDSASGGWSVVGGTSVGAPLIAAAYALAAHPAGPAYSYAHSGAFRPIGAAGYTLATGLGSPLGIAGF